MILHALAAATQDHAISKETLALITGGSAIAGALIGGAVTGGFALWGEGKRQEFARETRLAEERREDERERRIARGAAREMRANFRAASVFLERYHKLGFFWPDEADASALQPYPHIEDRKSLASLATDDEWVAIERAEDRMRDVVLYRTTHLATQKYDIDSGGRGFTPEGRSPEPVYFGDTHKETLAVMIEWIEGAAKALDRLAA